MTSTQYCDGWIEVADCGWLPLQQDGTIFFMQAKSKFLAGTEKSAPASPQSSRRSPSPPVAGWMIFNDSKIALFPKVRPNCVFSRVNSTTSSSISLAFMLDSQWQTYWFVLRGGYLYRYREKIAEDVYSKYERPAADPIQLTHLLSTHVMQEYAAVHDPHGKSLPKNLYVP